MSNRRYITNIIYVPTLTVHHKWNGEIACEGGHYLDQSGKRFLHLVSSSNEFSCYLIFKNKNYFPLA